MLTRATLIHCPRGGKANDDDLARAQELLSAHFELDVRLVQPDEQTAELARAAVARGSRLLIASGGDGTVSAVGSAILYHPEAALGILPRGTANSIAGHLGIPNDIEGACAVITGHHERVLDTARVNGRPMVLMMTIGVHADAVTEADPERKRKYGVLAYVLEEAQRLLEDSRFEVTLEEEGARLSCQASAVTVANLAPPTTLLAQGPDRLVDDDGLLDVTLVSISGVAEGIATTFHLATHAFAGLPADRENIGFFRAPSLRIETTEPRRVMVDGEDIGETPVTVECVPRSLRIKVPAPASAD